MLPGYIAEYGKHSGTREQKKKFDIRYTQLKIK